MDLSDLRARGAELLPPKPAPEPEPGAPAAPAAPVAIATPEQLAERLESDAREWGMIPYVFGEVLCLAMPELRPVYTEERCMEWGRKFTPVARHHGWTGGVALMWMGVAGVSWGFLKPTWDAVKARRAAAIAEEKNGPKKTDDKKPAPDA